MTNLLVFRSCMGLPGMQEAQPVGHARRTRTTYLNTLSARVRSEYAHIELLNSFFWCLKLK